MPTTNPASAHVHRQAVIRAGERPHIIILDIKAFEESLGSRPIFTQKLFVDAGVQLLRAENSQTIVLTDCYGRKLPFLTKLRLKAGRVPILRYNSIHTLADPFPYGFYRDHPGQDIRTDKNRDGGNLEDMIRFSKFPFYISFDQKVKEGRQIALPEFTRLISIMKAFWYRSIEREKLRECISHLKHTVQISNIVCIEPGSLDNSKSMVQHLVLCTIAQELTELYEQDGRALRDPIEIVAQDPGYTAVPREFFLQLPVPIRITNNPEAFACINDSSLVMSFNPFIPLRQIIADLATETPSGKGPAALFLKGHTDDEKLGNFDLVSYEWTKPFQSINPVTRRYVAMLCNYTKVMDGKELFGERFNDDFYERMYYCHYPWRRSDASDADWIKMTGIMDRLANQGHDTNDTIMEELGLGFNVDEALGFSARSYSNANTGT
ncbi:hypothetical protein BDW02DRAFT_70086 [Decorospora gaudefroyi]|uniref:SRR1-like domain-containing protein n=1 Tax=Decorospora gaudefroyi TaxID=184978 RepID=A0A6A5K843_9PLEO|nr:hypothetical protein BDW02DRAFT_70086 [Decorospora gaudefroyi]